MTDCLVRHAGLGAAVAATAAALLAVSSANAQPARPGQLISEYFGAAMFVDEFYKQTACSRPPNLPRNAEATAADFILKNGRRIAPGYSDEGLRKLLRQVAERERSATSKGITEMLAGMDTRWPGFCASLSESMSDMYSTARNDLIRAAGL